MKHELPARIALILFATVIVVWGLNWTLTKMIVAQVTPFWTAAIRTAIGAAALFALLVLRGQFIVPRRADLPVVFAIGFFHMIAFSALMTIGLKYVPVGRSIVLGYTTPLWVAPGAWLFLGEPIPRRRILGTALGLCGLLVMFNPMALDWSDHQALLGNGLLLSSALAWSVSILYVRAHRWIATPFQLVFWEALLATGVLTALAMLFEGSPRIAWTSGLAMLFAYSGLIATALGFWAMTVVNRSVPATTTSLGILATPIVGIATSVLLLGETVDLPLALATAMILSGIAIGAIGK